MLPVWDAVWPLHVQLPSLYVPQQPPPPFGPLLPSGGSSVGPGTRGPSSEPADRRPEAPLSSVLLGSLGASLLFSSVCCPVASSDPRPPHPRPPWGAGWLRCPLTAFSSKNRISCSQNVPSCLCQSSERVYVDVPSGDTGASGDAVSSPPLHLITVTWRRVSWRDAWLGSAVSFSISRSAGRAAPTAGRGDPWGLPASSRFRVSRLRFLHLVGDGIQTLHPRVALDSAVSSPCDESQVPSQDVLSPALH